MIIKLSDLIQYWKDTQLSHPPTTPLPWAQVLTATVTFLEKLYEYLGEPK